jgi:S1-C subfamily serine protease
VTRAWLVCLPLCALSSAAGCSPAAARDARVERLVGLSLAKVFVTSNPPDYGSPWQRSGISGATGSGAIVEGKRILTAAHVVADRVAVEVKRAGGTRRFAAKVEYVGHECDLALLSVEDEEFFAGTRPLALGGLPELRDRVDVYGFPEGGDRIAVTSGIVSRVEVGEYVHSNEQLLLVQIDAAINSGNSGGPVVAGTEMVGIAAETLEGAENIGYMIPTPILSHFLRDVADGRFDGFPRLGIETQPLENPGHRESLGLAAVEGGVLVTRVNHGTTADGVLAPGDVLLSVGGVELGRDGTVPLRGDERVHFSHGVTTRLVGDTVALGVWHQGKEQRREARLSGPRRLVPGPRYDVMPTYLIFAGVVFQPLDGNLVDLLGPWPQNVLGWTTVNNVLTAERRQVVWLSQVLSHPINQGFDDLGGVVVLRVNEQPVRDLRQLAEVIDAAGDGWVRFDLEGGQVMAFNAARARSAEAELLAAYSIPAARSSDLGSGATP